jgi:hypothetical protein
MQEQLLCPTDHGNLAQKLAETDQPSQHLLFLRRYICAGQKNIELHERVTTAMTLQQRHHGLECGFGDIREADGGDYIIEIAFDASEYLPAFLLGICTEQQFDWELKILASCTFDDRMVIRSCSSRNIIECSEMARRRPAYFCCFAKFQCDMRTLESAQTIPSLFLR